MAVNEPFKFNHHEYRIEPIKWQTLRPGNIIRLQLNDVIPADMLLLYSSDRQKICFVETANLDGETNLKQRETILAHDGRPFIIDAKFNYTLHAERPNNDLSSFHGYLAHFDGDDKKTVPVKMKNLLLRGCVLRNTDFVIGLVVYAGNETKALVDLMIRLFLT